MTRALPGVRYVASPSVRVQVRRVDGSRVWLELLVGGAPTGHMTKMHLEVFEGMFLREGAPGPSAHPPATGAPYPERGGTAAAGERPADASARPAPTRPLSEAGGVQ